MILLIITQINLYRLELLKKLLLCSLLNLIHLNIISLNLKSILMLLFTFLLIISYLFIHIIKTLNKRNYYLYFKLKIQEYQSKKDKHSCSKKNKVDYLELISPIIDSRLIMMIKMKYQLICYIFNIFMITLLKIKKQNKQNK